MKQIQERIVRTFDIVITNEMKQILEDNNVVINGEYDNDKFSCWGISNFLEPGSGWLSDDFEVITDEYDTNGNDSFIDEYGIDAEKCCVYCPLDNSWMDLGEFIKFCYDVPKGVEYCFEWTLLSYEKHLDKNPLSATRLQVIRDRKIAELI
jgi:hypothetical protein